MDETIEDFEQLIPGSRVFSNKPIAIDSEDDDDVILLDDVNNSNNVINLSGNENDYRSKNPFLLLGPEVRPVTIVNKQYPEILTINKNDLNKLVIYTDKELKQFVYYNGHKYVKMDNILVNETLPDIHLFKCYTSQKCRAILKLSDADYAHRENRVLIVNQHSCDRSCITPYTKDVARSDLFTRVKVVSYLDPKKSFKALKESYNVPDLNSRDSGTVVLYFNEKFDKLIYYMGREYCYKSKRCYQFPACDAKILFFIDKLKVYEIGKHSCFTDDLVGPGLSIPNYTPVIFVFYPDHVVPKLNPSDKNTVTVYYERTSKGLVKTVYYRGYTYLDESKKTVIYMCSRSKKCSGALGVNANKSEVSEIAKHTHCKRNLNRKFETSPAGFKPSILRRTATINAMASTSSFGNEAKATEVVRPTTSTLGLIKGKDRTITLSNTTYYEKDGKRYRYVKGCPATLATIKQLENCSSANEVTKSDIKVKEEADDISFDYHEVKEEKYESLDADDNFKNNSIEIVEVKDDPLIVKVESQVVFNPSDVLPKPKIEATETNKMADAPLLYETLTATTASTINNNYNNFYNNATVSDNTVGNTSQKFTQKNIKKSCFKNFNQINSSIKEYSKDDEHGVFFYVDNNNRKIVCYRGFTYFYDGRVYMCTNMRCAAALNETDDVYTVLGIHNCNKNNLGESTEKGKNAAIEELFKPYNEKINAQDTQVKLAKSSKRKQNFDTNNLGVSFNTTPKRVVISPNPGPNMKKTSVKPKTQVTDDACNLVVIKCSEPSFVGVPLNEQSSYTYVNKLVIHFRGYKHRWFQKCPWLPGAYVYLCINYHLCKCDGIVILKDGKITKTKDHSCRGKHGIPEFDANEKQKPIMYYSFTRRRRELFYKGFIYLSLQWVEPRNSQWVCSVSEKTPCLKIKGSNVILVQKAAHVCHLGQTRMQPIKKKPPTRSIKHYDLIPIFDEHDNHFMIYEGFIYEKKKAIDRAKWVCIKNKYKNCPGELTVDRHHNALASIHSCKNTAPDDTELPSTYYSGTRSSSKRAEFLMFGGYFYTSFKKELKVYHHWQCIYSKSKYLCAGLLTCKHDKPIAASNHSCKRGTAEQNQIIEDNISGVEKSNAGQSDNAGVVIRTEVDVDGVVQSKEIDFGEFYTPISDENELSNIIEIKDESDDDCEIPIKEEMDEDVEMIAETENPVALMQTTDT